MRTTRSNELQRFAKGLAESVSGHVVVHSGDRSIIPQGGSRRSEHLTTDINPEARGAIDFHVYSSAGKQVSDAQVASVAVNSGLAQEHGVRLIVHGVGTNTEGPHLHADLRTDVGHRFETGGGYTPLTPMPLIRMTVSSRGFDLFGRR